jgi:hypothetical protein
MYVEQWSQEEIEQYCENPNLLISKTNELRSRVIRELLVRLIRRMTSVLKYQGIKTTNISNDSIATKGA